MAHHSHCNHSDQSQQQYNCYHQLSLLAPWSWIQHPVVLFLMTCISNLEQTSTVLRSNQYSDMLMCTMLTPAGTKPYGRLQLQLQLPLPVIGKQCIFLLFLLWTYYAYFTH